MLSKRITFNGIRLFISVCALVVAETQRVHAIPPPDFIFNILSQIPQIAAIAVAFFSSGYGLLYRFFQSIPYKRVLLVLLAVAGLSAAVGIAYYWEMAQHQAEYEAWRIEQLNKTQEKWTESQQSLSDERKQEVINKLSNTENNISEAALSMIPDELQLKRAEKGKAFKSNNPVVISGYSDFFLDNLDYPIVMTNASLKTTIQEGNNQHVIVDAREVIEHEHGNLPGSIHIRYADLRAGAWRELPSDKYVYVVCYSAIRGFEVAEFLRSVGVVASFLEGGASKWVEDGGQWTGDTVLVNRYHESQHKMHYSKAQMQDLIKTGVQIVDARLPENYVEGQFAGAVHIPLVNTPSEELDRLIASIPAGSRILIVYDESWSKFSAFIAGVEFEKRGYIYLGRHEIRP